MDTVKNLYYVKATLLPVKVMALMSKYAQTIKEADGIVVPLSSLDVFKHLHNSFTKTNSASVQQCYISLLNEVNSNLLTGHMQAFSKLDQRVVNNTEADDAIQENSFLSH